MAKESMYRLHHRLMAVAGGFFGGYSILINQELFGNAQTANVISLVLALCGRNFYEVLLRLIGVFLYMAGTAAVVVMKHSKFHAWIRTTSVVLSLAMALVEGFLPIDLSLIVRLYPFFLAMSFQWSAFPGAYGYASSSIFSTNNVKQLSISATEYLYSKDKNDCKRALFFLGTLLFYHIGVVASYIAVVHLHHEAVFVLAAYLIFVLFVVWHKE